MTSRLITGLGLGLGQTQIMSVQQSADIGDFTNEFTNEFE